MPENEDILFYRHTFCQSQEFVNPYQHLLHTSQFTHSIQRDVGHPILLLIIRHRKAQTFKRRICQYKMTKRLCSNIFLSLYLYRNDASTLLDKEIQFSIAMLAAPIIYEYIRHRYHLLQNKLLGKHPLEFCECIIAHQHQVGRSLTECAQQAQVKEKQLKGW